MKIRRFIMDRLDRILSITDFDENSNIVYFKSSKVEEKWYDYDSNNNLIHFKDFTGFEYIQKFDQYNNRIFYSNSYGFEMRYHYDYENDKVYYEDSEGGAWISTIEEANKVNKDDTPPFRYVYKILEEDSDENNII